MNKLLLGVPALMMIASPAWAQALTPAEFVRTAGASDLYERQSSQIVLQSTTNPAVRKFATMMVADHAKSTADVTAAALKSRIKVAAPALTPLQAEMIAQLKAENGAARDAAYLSQQKAAHQQALAVHTAYSTGGTSTSLKAVAAKVVPVVQHHIEMLKTM